MEQVKDHKGRTGTFRLIWCLYIRHGRTSGRVDIGNSWFVVPGLHLLRALIHVYKYDIK